MYLSAFPVITVGAVVPPAVPVTVKTGLTLLPGQILQPKSTAILPDTKVRTTVKPTTKAPPTVPFVYREGVLPTPPGTRLPAAPPPVPQTQIVYPQPQVRLPTTALPSTRQVEVAPQGLVTPVGMETPVVDIDLAPVPEEFMDEEEKKLPGWVVPVGIGVAALLAWKLLK